MAQHVYSLDGQKNPVYIESANPQNIYFCPDCNGEMIVKNQGAIREHHFAHKNCNDHDSCGESETHSDTVLFLLEIFRSLLDEGKTLKQIKSCPEPEAKGHVKYNEIPYGISSVYPYNKIKAVGNTFIYDILQNIDQVEREYSVTAPDGSLFRPDLALLQKNKLIKAVEVVYSHEDSPEKTQFYQENMIDVIRVDVGSFEDFLDLKKEWDSDSKLRTTIYVNNQLLVLTTQEMLIQNLRTREMILTLNSLLSELEEYNNEVNELDLKIRKLKIDYINFSKEILAEKLRFVEDIESILKPQIEESIEIIMEASKIKFELDSLYRDYKVLISDIAIERAKIHQKKNSEDLKKLMDSAEAIVKAFTDYSSKNDFPAICTPHFFATQIQSEEPYFLRKRLICLMMTSGVLIVENESYKLISGEIIIHTSDS